MLELKESIAGGDEVLTPEPSSTKVKALAVEDESQQDYFFSMAGDGGLLAPLRVEPQEALRVQLEKGDLLTICCPYTGLGADHGDSCDHYEILGLDANGKQASDKIELRAGDAALTNATATKAQLTESSRAASKLQACLGRWGVTSKHLDRVLKLSSAQTAQLSVTQPLTLVVLATGTSMSVEQQSPVSELRLQLQRSSISADNANSVEYLPEPLAPPLRELRIDRATAASYEVKAGEWIQIIDVAGKQCSDFVAFDKAALANGQELGLDAVATRTVVGLDTPTPGIHSRFLGADMQTMVELVQDTVGRHDAFLMACSPKYYEDSGYFGHISCTENFNKVLAEKGIAPKPAWPAINFFFNTAIEPCGTVSMDEPWSRPGDYVLLRAARDLICASSACPDDIDPANGWVPSDIHVRIYGAEHQFERAIATRLHPEEAPRMTKKTGFYPAVSALTKQLVEYQGYWVASEYEGWGANAEYLACRERVAMIDLSALRKFEITGPDALDFMQHVLTRNVGRLAIGEIAYSAMCQDSGGMIDDGTIFRMGEQAFRWICGDPYSGEWLIEQAKTKGYWVNVRNSSEQIHNIAVQGPQSRELLKQLIWTPECQPDLDNLAWFHFTIGRLGGPDGVPVMVSRTGYTGELGFEVWCHPDEAVKLWQSVWHKGQQYDIAPLGFDALDMLRIEAGLIFAHHEFCPETNPFEAGIGFTVPLKTKQDDFIGREAIARQSPESRKKLVGFILDDDQPVSHGDLVYHGRFPVGVVTSACVSPLMAKRIAMCRVAPEYASPGTSLEIGQLDGVQKRLAGSVTNLPFYDPERTRVRS